MIAAERIITGQDGVGSGAEAVAGYVPIALGAADYVELLPVAWHAINKDGVRRGKRTYDCKALRRYHRQHSGIERKKGLWEVHHDPYDISRIWVRNHHDPGGGWITVPWSHLRSAPAPFGELAWKHAREILARRGQDKATEAEIAQAAAELLDKAGRGPGNDGPPERRRDRRVVGRTRATSYQTDPRPAMDPDDDEPDISQPVAEDPYEAGQQATEIIPLPVFDARKEAELWRY